MSLLFISGWGATAAAWERVLSCVGRDRLFSFFSWHEGLSGLDSLRHRLAGFSEPVILVGWSLGGLIALEAVSAFPEEVSGLVLIGGTSRMTSDNDYPGVSGRVLQGMVRKLRQERGAVLRDFAEKAVSPCRDESWGRDYVAMAENFDTRELIAGLEFLQKTDLRGALSRIRHPVRILHGGGDRIVPCGQAVCLDRNLANGSLTLVEEGGHALPYTHPHQIVHEIEMLENA